jgi:hypothetical protein
MMGINQSIMIDRGENDMSLDISLYDTAATVRNGTGIFIRDGGANREITWDEWREKFPGREPVVVERDEDTHEVFDRNITHNLNTMAEQAGLYQAMWRPEELGITKAGQLIELLRTGLDLLKSDRSRFEAFNPKNGWGNYDNLVDFVQSYLTACEEYPNANISVSR